MVKSVKLKKVLKSSIFKFASTINKIIPKNDNKVMLYSANRGIEFNLKPLLEFMLEKEMYNQYEIICVVEGKKYFDNLDNVKYLTRIKGMLQFFRTKYVFYTAGQIPIKPAKGQTVIHMSHGTCDYKTMGLLTNINNGDEFFFNYMITTGEYYKPIVAKEYKCSEENVFVCNEPTTDAFYKPLKQKYDLGSYNKVLLWLPTFRKSDSLNYSDSEEERLLPCFDNEDYEELNEALQRKNYKLIVKLHTAQRLQNYKFTEFSNLFIYSNDDFVNLGYELYQLLMQVDVLIGDYSSVSLQFLLLDKPMAYVIPDIESYNKERGFVFDNPEDYMPGYIVKNKEQFYQFLDELSKGKDTFADKRKKVKEIIHKYDDGKSCERLLALSGISLTSN